jgi:hypothetical protein
MVNAVHGGARVDGELLLAPSPGPPARRRPRWETEMIQESTRDLLALDE